MDPKGSRSLRRCRRCLRRVARAVWLPSRGFSRRSTCGAWDSSRLSRRGCLDSWTGSMSPILTLRAALDFFWTAWRAAGQGLPSWLLMRGWSAAVATVTKRSRFPRIRSILLAPVLVPLYVPDWLWEMASW